MRKKKGKMKDISLRARALTYQKDISENTQIIRYKYSKTVENAIILLQKTGI